MPIQYEIDAGAGRVDCTHVGTVSDDEFLATYQRMYSDPAFDGSYDILVDLLQAESTPRGAQALKMIADIGRRHHKPGEKVARIAIVAGADLSFGLARMYEGYAAEVPANIRVFRERDQALEWLAEPASE
jgi:hypothetical protein